MSPRAPVPCTRGVPRAHPHPQRAPTPQQHTRNSPTSPHTRNQPSRTHLPIKSQSCFNHDSIISQSLERMRARLDLPQRRADLHQMYLNGGLEPGETRGGLRGLVARIFGVCFCISIRENAARAGGRCVLSALACAVTRESSHFPPPRPPSSDTRNTAAQRTHNRSATGTQGRGETTREAARPHRVGGQRAPPRPEFDEFHRGRASHLLPEGDGPAGNIKSHGGYSIDV